jgi:hypothetical protein
LSAITARMVLTGVPENDAIEKATSCQSALRSNAFSSSLLRVDRSQ